MQLEVILFSRYGTNNKVWPLPALGVLYIT